MFTKITLRNFRSFDYIELDLTKKGKEPKNLAIIYGENGAGKSNLISAFVLLTELLDTMNVRDAYEEMLKRSATFNDEDFKKSIRQHLLEELRDIQAIIDDYRMIGNEEPIVAEYEFCINGNHGKYILEMDQSEITHERLEYLLNSRRGIYFDCTRDNIAINGSLVTERDLFADIKASAKRFWGKHSMFAIVLHEIRDKSKTYAWENISKNFSDVLDLFQFLSCSLDMGARKWNNLESPFAVLRSPIRGKITKKRETELDTVERIFSKFFSAINSNVKEAYYERTYVDSIIEYKLYLKKFIANSYRNIPFSCESTGNRQLLEVLRFTLWACIGGIVVIDEADSGIHDLLFQKTIMEISEMLNGQLIMTIHNTLLMEAPFSRESVFILSEETAGHKTIRCISDYENRTYITNNIRNKYLHNAYGGVPEVHAIDFNGLVKELLDELDRP